MTELVVSSPYVGRGSRDFGISFKRGVSLYKHKLKGERKYKVEAEHFSWHQEFCFSLCLNIFVIT